MCSPKSRSRNFFKFITGLKTTRICNTDCERYFKYYREHILHICLTNFCNLVFTRNYETIMSPGRCRADRRRWDPRGQPACVAGGQPRPGTVSGRGGSWAPSWGGGAGHCCRASYSSAWATRGRMVCGWWGACAAGRHASVACANAG